MREGEEDLALFPFTYSDRTSYRHSQYSTSFLLNSTCTSSSSSSPLPTLPSPHRSTCVSPNLVSSPSCPCHSDPSHSASSVSLSTETRAERFLVAVEEQKMGEQIETLSMDDDESGDGFKQQFDAVVSSCSRITTLTVSLCSLDLSFLAFLPGLFVPSFHLFEQLTTSSHSSHPFEPRRLDRLQPYSPRPPKPLRTLLQFLRHFLPRSRELSYRRFPPLSSYLLIATCVR
jgi:hypothetical protein